MSDETPKDQVARYWWGKALDSLESARRELSEGAHTFAINRAYYALFYAVSAVFVERGRRFSKHSGIRAAFNREIVKAGYLDGEHGALYNQLFRARQEGDYMEFVDFDFEYSREKIEACKSFLEALRPLLKSFPPEDE